MANNKLCKCPNCNTDLVEFIEPYLEEMRELILRLSEERNELLEKERILDKNNKYVWDVF